MKGKNIAECVGCFALAAGVLHLREGTLLARRVAATSLSAIGLARLAHARETKPKGAPPTNPRRFVGAQIGLTFNAKDGNRWGYQDYCEYVAFRCEGGKTVAVSQVHQDSSCWTILVRDGSGEDVTCQYFPNARLTDAWGHRTDAWCNFEKIFGEGHKGLKVSGGSAEK